MSRAFVKDQDDFIEDAGERPVSPHPNLVTERGLSLIDEELERLRKDLAHAMHEANRAAISSLSRDLRYWTQRRTTAQLVPATKDTSKVAFGHRVTILRDDGRRQTFAIVGEDEADPGKGFVAYVTPVARAVLGRSIGDEIDLPGGTAEIEKIE
ncbi:MAG: transcription elongation factor GreA [Rhizobiales bacterium]|nr:transcription elongation factor GreA [Hyphomicrobiales bacterium]